MVFEILKMLWEGLLNLFYPEGVSCSICGDEIGDVEIDLCKNCIGEIEFIKDSFCEKCGKILSDANKSLCSDCRRKDHYFVKGRSVGVYEKGLKEYIYLFKYNRYRNLAAPLGDLMGIYIDRFFSRRDFDLITYIPSHQERIRERGFNQARLLANRVGERLNLESKGLLKRRSETIKQSKLARAERIENIKGKFILKDGILVKDKSILLVDDIYTTGATVNEASKVFLDKGADKIQVITLATGRDVE